MFSEIDDERWEKRKVEVFLDGTTGFSDDTSEAGGTRLGIVEFPQLSRFAGDPEFTAYEITVSEFEEVWNNRLKRLRGINES